MDHEEGTRRPVTGDVDEPDADPLTTLRARTEAGDLPGALGELDILLTNLGDAPVLRFWRAQVLLDLGRGAEAQRDLWKAVRLDHNFAPAYYALGVLAYRQRKFGAARKSLTMAANLDPTPVEALLLLADIELRAGRWPQILAAAERALEIDHSNPDARVYRGWALVGLGRHKEVDHATWSALDGSPTDAFAYRVRGWAALHQGLISKAEDGFRLALKASPADPEARLGLVETLKARNPIYARILRADLWLTRHRRTTRFALLFLFLFLLGGVLEAARLLGGGRLDSTLYQAASTIVGLLVIGVIVSYAYGTKITDRLLRFNKTAQEVLWEVDAAAEKAEMDERLASIESGREEDASDQLTVREAVSPEQ